VRDGERYTPAGDPNAACATTGAGAGIAGTVGVNGETAADA
jgi:hypothetical protein